MNHLRSSSIVILSLAVIGCAPKVAPPAAAPEAASGAVPTAGVIEVQVDPVAAAQAKPTGPDKAEQAVLEALVAAQPRATSCYTAALEADPYLYGEVVVRLALDAEGRVLEAVSLMDTVGDRELVSCVERLAHALSYPAPGGEGLSLRYPFLFTSNLTPPEVVRAMKAHHGLIEEGTPGTVDIEAPGRVPDEGTIEGW